MPINVVSVTEHNPWKSIDGIHLVISFQAYLDHEFPLSRDRWNIHFTLNECTTSQTCNIFIPPIWWLEFITIGLILFWPYHMNSFNNFCMRLIWTFVIKTALRIQVKTEKIKVLETNILASKDRFLPDHLEIIALALQSCCSKLSLLRSLRPR